MKDNWQKYWQNKRNRTVFIFSAFFLSVVLFCFLHFLTFIEGSKGYIFNDPILNLFAPIDLSLPTFIITYSFVLSGIIITFRNPGLFVKLVQGYAILTLFRIISLYSITLEPPAAIIPLQDIFLQSTFYSGRVNLKDLFFSGHTAILFLFAFDFKNPLLKRLFIAGGIVIGILLMLQHVHFSVDVFAAPVFAYFTILIREKINFQ
jgi:hypothetical protein